MSNRTYIALATFTATGSQTSVTFSNIPNTYRDLIIQGDVRGNSSNGVLNMNLNGDSSNMSSVRFYGLSSITGSDRPAEGLASATIGNTWANLVINIMDYSASDKHKTTLVRSNDPNIIGITGAARWASLAPVTSVTITSNRTFQSGMTLSLYGIAG